MLGSFTAEEIAYIASQPLARLATVDPDGQPDVVPVVFEFDGRCFYIGGRSPERTRKFLNVQQGNRNVSLVIDDLASRTPWAPRFLRVYGSGEIIEQHHGAFGSGRYLRVTPRVSWSWNLAGHPYTATHNSDVGSRKTIHDDS
ncbi:PPOX class F420-dependent oxidoreductase [Streptomyces mirabilis]|uniref:PPOX class F420-dependent oxidoreductase n=1 Tax=Streptomyces mirabilis TaxID=68239 RepID=UPI0033188899